MSSIKFIGVLSLVCRKLLIRLINSVDYPVDIFVILFQDGFRDFDFNLINNPLIKKFEFISCDMNVGVSRGWNYLIRNYSSPYWIISGDDNYFEKGTLKNIAKFMDNESSQENVFCGLNMKTNENKIIPAGFNTFVITSKIFEKIGLFDENIYPAYFEDNDLWTRIILSGEKVTTISDCVIMSGIREITGSCTLNAVNINYRKKMDKCYKKNEEYFKSKWNSSETPFLYPFNNPEYSIKDSVLHPNYHENQLLLLGHKNSPNFFVKK
jgi:GT2 family glycosyltransferase